MVLIAQRRLRICALLSQYLVILGLGFIRPSLPGVSGVVSTSAQFVQVLVTQAGVARPLTQHFRVKTFVPLGFWRKSAADSGGSFSHLSLC